MYPRGKYRSSSTRKYSNFKPRYGGQSRKFSRTTAAGQRDTVSVVVKQTYGAKIDIVNGGIRFGFNPFLNLMKASQMHSYLKLYDQVRMQGVSIKMQPFLQANTEMYNMMFRWYRDGVPSIDINESNSNLAVTYDYLGPEGVIYPVLSPIRQEV